MKREATRFSLLIVTIILVTQLAALSTVTQAAQTQRGKQTYMRKIPSEGQVSSGQRRCLRRCKREFERCIEQAGGSERRRRACEARGRNCVRRCGIRT